MPVVSLYRANRLWHKGEIAEKGKRKEERGSIFRPIVGLGLRLICSLCPKRGNNLLIKQDKWTERSVCSTLSISLGYTIVFLILLKYRTGVLENNSTFLF